MSIARSLITIVAGASVMMMMSCRAESPAPRPPLRLTLSLSDELVSGGEHSQFGLAIAPDGRRLVIAAAPNAAIPRQTSEDSGGRRLYLRDLSGDGWQPLAQTDGAEMPFWSPDGLSLGFFAAGKLRVLRLSAGDVHDVADAPSPRGGAWHPSGDIIFAPRADGSLMRRTAEGALTPWTTLDRSESSHRFPQLVANDHLVFFVRAEEPTRQGVWIAPRGAPHTRKRLVGSDAHGVVTDTVLLHASGDALMAQRIDLETLVLAGRPQLVGNGVARSAEHELLASVGGEVLLYGNPSSSRRELRWVDQSGANAGQLGEPMNAADVRIAPSGSHVAVARVDPQLRTLDIWVYDEQRPVPRRLSQGIDADESPAWHPSGDRIAWVSGRRSVITRDARAAQPDQTLHKFADAVRISDWSPDGRWIVLSTWRPTGADIMLLDATTGGGSERVRPYATAPFTEHYATVSPDGGWLAYVSDESGSPEIYVDTFPMAGRRTRVTVGGGTEPRWMRDGAALLYRRGSEVHVVSLAVNAARRDAIASRRLLDAAADIRAFDVTPDGRRLLLNVPAPRPTSGGLTAVVPVQSLLPSAP